MVRHPPDGETGPCPSAELPARFSPDQEAAWQALKARLAAHGIDLDVGRTAPAGDIDEGEVVAVTGRAGSGKTVLLARLAARLGEIGLAAVRADHEPRHDRRSFAVLAPTNKAASVLGRLGIPATTIHRVVYRPLYAPEYEPLVEWIAGERKTRPEVAGLDPGALERARAFFATHGSVAGALAAAGIRGADFIRGWERRSDPLDIALVDEASMVDAPRLDDLARIFRLVVLFGDPAQLAPVGSGGRMVFADLPEARRLQLSRVHRQEAGSPILDLAHALADPALDFATFENLVAAAAERDPRVVVAGAADADLMCESPVLVWRNHTRMRLIAGFRAAHGIGEAELVPGEPLICDGLELPARRWRQRALLEAHGVVKGATATFLGPGRRPGFARLRIHGATESGISVAAIIQIERPGDEDPVMVSAASAGAVFLHGAAVTIHKAQGSQWPAVQVFAPDLRAAARSGAVEDGIPLWKRLAYVAVTRAEARLIWLTRWRIARPDAPLGAAGG